MARVSSASDIQDTPPAMVAFKWEASPGKPLKEANISEATLCPSLKHPLQPPPGRLTEEVSFTRASASKISNNIAGLWTKLFHVELESSKQEKSLSPFKLASGRSLRDGVHKRSHTTLNPNSSSGASSNRAYDEKTLGKLVDKLQKLSFLGEAETSTKDRPLDSLQLPPGKRPKDGFYLQYPRPLAVVKVNPASEVLNSGRALVQKRLKEILCMQRKPSSVVKCSPSDDGEKESPVRIFDLPESDVGSSSRCRALNMRCNNLEGLHMKRSLIAHCFTVLGLKKFSKGRREGGLSDSDEEGGSPFANFELSKDKADRYGRPISRKCSRSKTKGSHLAKCFPFDGSLKVSNKRGEGGNTDHDEEGDQDTETPKPSAFSRTSSPNSRGSKHGLRSCFSLPRRHTPSCQVMATMLMSLFPLKYDADSDEEHGVAVSEYYSNQAQRHQPEEHGIFPSSSSSTGIQFNVAEESSPRSSLDEYHPDNYALKSVSQLEAGKRPGEWSSSVQILGSSFLRTSCLQTNFDHKSAETSVSDYDHLHTLITVSKSPLHGAQQKFAARGSSEKPYESNMFRSSSNSDIKVQNCAQGFSSSSSSDAEHPYNLSVFQNKAQQKIPGRSVKDMLKSSPSRKPSSRRAVEPSAPSSSLNVEGLPVPNFVWSPILQIKDEETSAMRNSPQGKLQASSSAKINSTHENGEQESSPCIDFREEHQHKLSKSMSAQLNTRSQIFATCRSSPEKFTSGSDSLRNCAMRSRLGKDCTSSWSNGENNFRTYVSNSTSQLKAEDGRSNWRSSSEEVFKLSLSRNKLEQQPSPRETSVDEYAKIMATKSQLHSELELATITKLPAVISGSVQDCSASCRSSQEEPSHKFRRETSDSAIPSMLAPKPATWWSSDEIFKGSALGKSATPHKLQQRNSSPRSSVSEDIQAQKSVSKPTLHFNPAPSSATRKSDVRSSSLQRSPSHVRHHGKKTSPRSLPAEDFSKSVMSMVAQWESRAGVSSSKSAPLQWHGRWTLS